MLFLLKIMYFAVVLIFGIAVSLKFGGVCFTRRNLLFAALFSAAELVLQSVCYLYIGVGVTTKLYPLIVHLPLLIFMMTVMGKPFSLSAVSILSSYLCCQIPRWLASAGFLFDRNYPLYNVVYLAAAILTYVFISQYVAYPMNRFITASKKQCLLMGTVPFFYYVFDYATTVYTDMLFMGTKAAVQFMPSVMSVVYFGFVLLYYREVQKQESAQREKDMLAVQISEACKEMRLLRKMQENAAVYRHDMKHHLILLRSYASEGDVEKINAYLSQIFASLERITPVRFTCNETVNLILSSFETQAKQKSITFDVSAALPINDAEIGSLLFNGLENALHAAEKQGEAEDGGKPDHK